MNQHKPLYYSQYIPCEIFGVASIPGQTPLFHILCDDGGVYWRLPVSAFCWKKEAPNRDLTDLVLWDSFSYNVTVTTFDLLRNKAVSYVDRNKTTHKGIYQFTLDWFGDNDSSFGFAEVPGQHKCGHFIRLDDGNFAIQPNNRLKIHDPNFVTKTDNYPRLLSDRIYSAEQTDKWRTSDDDNYDYNLENSQ
jgi:hypothetical protein